MEPSIRNFVEIGQLFQNLKMETHRQLISAVSLQIRLKSLSIGEGQVSWI
jgi:hypothetical protein